MSKLVSKWQVTEGYHKGTQLEEYEHGDGTREHFLFRDRLGRPANPDKQETETIIKRYGMKKVL